MDLVDTPIKPNKKRARVTKDVDKNDIEASRFLDGLNLNKEVDDVVMDDDDDDDDAVELDEEAEERLLAETQEK